MSDVLKLTEEELKSLQESIAKLNEAKTILGDITTQAHFAQLMVLEQTEYLNKIQKLLEDKYGAISVDINNGEYSELTEE